MNKTETKPYADLGKFVDIVNGLWYAVDEDGRQALATCAADIPAEFGEPRPLTDSRDDALWYDETAAVLPAATVSDLRAALVALATELQCFSWAFCSEDAFLKIYFLDLSGKE